MPKAPAISQQDLKACLAKKKTLSRKTAAESLRISESLLGYYLNKWPDVKKIAKWRKEK
jgi:hypothetical protein